MDKQALWNDASLHYLAWCTKKGQVRVQERVQEKE
jgi:hypothetical protein